MKRPPLALASTLTLTLTFIACSEDEKEPTSECNCATGGTPGGAGGEGNGEGGKGPSGGGVGEGGEGPVGNCTGAYGADVQILSIMVPGYGSWPELLSESGPGGLGGAGPNAQDDEIGCDWVNPDAGYADVGSISCSGTASIERITGGADDELEATFADGSVARVVIPGAALPASGQVDLGLSQSRDRANPFALTVRSSSSARDVDSGAVLWVVQGLLDPASAETLFGEPVVAKALPAEGFDDPCFGPGTRQEYEHVLESTPEQRIASGETTVVETEAGSYDVYWYAVETTFVAPEFNCPDATFPAPKSGRFSMVLCELE